MTRRIESSDVYVAISERELKERVLKLAYQCGWIVFHMTHSPSRGSQGKGYPDLTLARDGEVLWMELKTNVGVLSPEQRVWLAALPHAHVITPTDWWSGRVGELLG